MFLVTQKFKMFGGSAEAVEELVKFKNNFEILQTKLGALEVCWGRERGEGGGRGERGAGREERGERGRGAGRVERGEREEALTR
jgi:hypothetical protein